MTPILANIFGPDTLIVIAVVALLFGSSQLPKLARSLGSAKTEFEKAQREGNTDASRDSGTPKGPPPVS